MTAIVTLAKGNLLLVHDMEDVSHVLSNVHPHKLVRHPQTGAEIVATKHSLSNVHRLRNIGIHAPSPVLLQYDWPGMYVPMDHQRETVDFLSTCLKGFDLSGMGTGKTAAVLWAADYLMKLGVIRRMLVIAPLSCLNRVWADEVFRILPHRTVQVLHSERDRRKYMARRSLADIFVLNHDGLEVIKNEMVQRKDIDLVVLDEAAAYRNARTDRYKVVRAVVKHCHARLWCLTGTPTPNAPTDAWALARLVNLKGTEPSFTRFRETVMWKATPFKWRPRNTAKEKVYEILQPAIRHKKEDCGLDLPPVVYTDREVQMSKEQKQAYEQMRKHLIAEAAGQQITAINAAGKMIKLLQICCGSVYADDGSVAELPMPDRLRVLMELIEQADAKTVVFVPFRHSILRVHDHILGAGIGCGMIHGGVSQKDRDSIIQSFQHTSDIDVLVAQPRAASHGLNLTAANVTTWFAPTFSAEQYAQANERMNRPGQTLNMTVAHMGCHALEWGAYKSVADKVSRQQSILALYEKVLGQP